MRRDLLPPSWAAASHVVDVPGRVTRGQRGGDANSGSLLTRLQKEAKAGLVPGSQAPLITSGMGAFRPGSLWGWQREGASSESERAGGQSQLRTGIHTTCPASVLNLTHVLHSPSRFLPLPSGLSPTTGLQRGRGEGSELLISLKSTAGKMQEDCSHHPITHSCPSLPR